MSVSPRPHDLLRLTNADMTPPDAPEWVRHALKATPWAVVRRAAPVTTLIPVGIRGSHRSDRYAMTVATADIAELVPPEQLAERDVPACHRAPAMRALDGLRDTLDRTGLPWGPTGSVGFELATGAVTATEESDLDLLVRVPRLGPEVLAQLTALHQLFMEQAARIDCQVETDWGAAALVELMAGRPEILMRTHTGAQLVPRVVAIS